MMGINELSVQYIPWFIANQINHFGMAALLSACRLNYDGSASNLI